jgi:hypothetical protein
MRNIILVVVTAGLFMGAKAFIPAKEGREAEHKSLEVSPENLQPPAPLPERPAVRMFNRWLDELTKAYQENDREKMGQLIKRMHQFRQNRPAFGWGRAAPGGPLPGRARGRPDIEEGPPRMGRFRGPQEGWRGFQPRMGRQCPCMPPPESMEGPPPVMPDEYMDRPGPDLPPPGGMRGPRPPAPLEEMGPPMEWGRGRGMGPPSAGERPFPQRSWWRYQDEPEME